jgi:hypothetical protein
MSGASQLGQSLDKQGGRRSPPEVSMKIFRKTIAVVLLAAAGIVSNAMATSFSTDQSDAWAAQGESGWGFLSFQRGSVIFGAIFVYDQTNTPIWYSATLFNTGNLVWSGDLYETTGPSFGAAFFNQNAVVYRKVGTMTWTATSVTTGQLRYDVDGVFVVKNMARQFVVFDDFGGHFAGGIHEATSGCANPSFNITEERLGILNITQNGQSIALTSFPTSGPTCSYNGTLTQAGQMGAIQGTYNCSSGEVGSFQAFEMQVNPVAVTGRFTTNSTNLAGCHSEGYFGGMRITTF